MCPETPCLIVDFPEDNLLRSKLSPGQSTSKQVVPPDTLLRSKLSSGHFTSKQTVPSQGGNLLRGGSLSFEVKCPGRTVCFKVKCPGDSLLRSNLPPGHYTSGGKLLRDRPRPYQARAWLRHCLEKSLQLASGIVLLVTSLASDMAEEGKDLGDLDKRLHAWSW